MEEQVVKKYQIAETLTEFEILEKYINKRVELRLKERYIERYQSEKIDQLCAALAKAQGDFPSITTNRYNDYTFTPYSDIDIIMETVRPILKENALSITFQEFTDDNRTLLSTKVHHESSQYIETRMRIKPSKDDIQAYISHVKELKRHAIMSLLNLTIKYDEQDDNGEQDMIKVREELNKGTGINRRYSAKKQSFSTITKKEADDLEYVCGNHVDLVEHIFEKLKITSLHDIPRSKYEEVRKYLLKRVNAREGK